MAARSDQDFIELALKLAEKGLGKTSPNPLVGAIVVKNGRIVGQGYHKKAGTHHAEVVALNQAGAKAHGATLYVNLEPCCHAGQTGPCTKKIIKAGIKEVVYSIKDPNPMVNGKGVAELRRAGIKARDGILKEKARRLNEVHLKWITTGHPFVTLKMAQSLDGQIATGTGNSHWISGIKSRRLAHHLRSINDAVVIGAGTVRADNPSLTVRHVKGKNPYRIVISSYPDFQPDFNLFKDKGDTKTIVVSSAKSAKLSAGLNANFWNVRKNKNGLSLTDFLDKASKYGLTSLLVEGGSRLAASFIKHRLVDKFVFVVAPSIIGSGLGAIGDLGVKRVADSVKLKLTDINKSGNDMVITAYPEYN
jgi:diaminohydroxyphosphoribosylaminopyrimidine deaminase/5-amino-6-(5-phosphoribosylamino)uracil reductase